MDPRKIEFIGLFQALGWQQNQLARELAIGKSAVSQFLNPENDKAPSDQTLVYLRRIVAERRPDLVTAGILQQVNEFHRLVVTSRRSVEEIANHLRRPPEEIHRYMQGMSQAPLPLVQSLKLLIGEKSERPRQWSKQSLIKDAPSGLDPAVTELVEELEKLDPETRKQVSKSFADVVKKMPRNKSNRYPSGHH